MARALPLALLVSFCVGSIQVHGKPNVLFLMSDDLRPELGTYYEEGSSMYPNMYTPNLDALAAQSLVLKRAYAQQAVCNPSRSSLLTGRRPETTRVHDNDDYFRESGGDFTTIPQYFKENGYHSIGMGKIFHSARLTDNDPPSWSDPDDYYHAPSKDYWGAKNASWQAVPAEDREKLPLPDDQVAEHAIETLRQVAEQAISGEQPFFIAVGFDKPHLPFQFPEEFLDLYPMEDIFLAANPYAPVDMPDAAWYNWGELRGYDDIIALNVTGEINTTLPDYQALDMRRAYYSSVSYIDELVGEVLQELEDLGLANNTIISFMGDHGWQLGEHSEWCKHTNFDIATNCPLMVHIPGLTDGGIVSEELTEFVDLFPTLAEAAGLTVPPLCPEDSSDVTVCREGDSLLPLILNPEDAQWKDKVFSWFPRVSDREDVMGYSMRTDRYRYSEWPLFDLEEYVPDWDTLHGVELYDHHGQYQENVNLADHPEYADIREELSRDLRAGWRQQTST